MAQKAIATIMLLFLLIVTASAQQPPSVALWWNCGSTFSTSVAFPSAATWGDDGEYGSPWYWESTCAGFYRENGFAGWDGVTGWYRNQAVPAPPRGSRVTVIGLHVWQPIGYTYDTFTLDYTAGAYAMPSDWRRILRLVRVPDGVAYSGDWEWELPLATEKLGLYELASFPAYLTGDPSTGYIFEIEVFHVPEPSSLLALLTGLAGLGAILRRQSRW